MPTSGKKILIVEDNAVTRAVVRIALAAQGHAILEAEDARTAMDLMASSTPDLVIQDLMLPDMDGLHLVHRLHQLPGCDQIPILAFSAFSGKLNDARLDSGSFAGYLLKPVDPRQLIEIVARYI